MTAARALMGRFDLPDAATQHIGSVEKFAFARRHSSRVRFMRKAIPLGVMIAVSALLAIWLFDPFRKIVPGFSIADYKLSATEVTMDRPHLTGFKKDNRPYDLVARAATQDIHTPQIVNLVDMDAHLAMEGDQKATLSAKHGIYDTQNETMDVKTDVRVKTTSGYDIKLDSAKMTFKTGDISSTDPVEVKTATGNVNANALQVVGNGKRLTFIGKVRSRMDPVSDGDASKAHKP
jgi:lipopolysaccharide export system protein LptC